MFAWYGFQTVLFLPSAQGERPKRRNHMKTRTLLTVLALGIVSSSFASQGAVYTSSNQAEGNSILAFRRDSKGQLTPNGSYPTGGLGTGGGLGNQGAVTISDDDRYLYTVNAGSNSLSVFKLRGAKPMLVDVISSGGVRPISVTQKGRLVYVLNAGDANNAGNIHGFFQTNSGDLISIPGAESALSAASVGPAQIQFNPADRSLVVTEKATNLIDTFELNLLGQPISASFNPSNGQTPFGFDFDRRGRLFVSEAFGGAVDGSAVSSYRIRRNQDIDVLSGSAPTTETAACWVVVGKSGKFVYAANAGSSSITGYRVANDGSITLLNQDGVTGSTGVGSAPTDVAISNDGEFFYARANGTNNIISFRIKSNGQLETIDNDGGLPNGTNGLAAR
jgi:6-phosphogluconolactonase